MLLDFITGSLAVLFQTGSRSNRPAWQQYPVVARLRRPLESVDYLGIEGAAQVPQELVVLPFPASLQYALEGGPVAVYAWLRDGTVERVSPPTGDYIQSSIAPDGTAVAYSGCSDGTSGVWTTALKDHDPVRITSPDVTARHPAFSRDGKLLVFSSDANSTGTRYQYDRDGLVRMGPLTQLDEQTHIYMADSDGRNERQITSGPYCDTRPALSPDNNIVAFNSNRSGQQEIWLASTDGANEPKQLMPGVAGTRPCWNLDGRSLFFQLLDELGHQIHILDVETGVTRHLEANRTPGWTRGAFALESGADILVHSNRNGYIAVYEISIDEETSTEVMPPGFSEAMHATEALDGTRSFDSRNRLTNS